MSNLSIKMQEESEQKVDSFTQPVMNRHRPASEKTQDISHLLASMFKELYTMEVIGKDTTANLIKSRRQDDSYHDKYVEELKQVRSEFNKRISNADMLVSHIIQAQLHASAKEQHAQAMLLEDIGVDGHQYGITPVKSALIWCVDNSLLKKNNLICCHDYIKHKIPRFRAPRVKSAPAYTDLTFSFKMHINTEPQDDGYTLIPIPTPISLEDSEKSRTRSSSPKSSSYRTTPSQKTQQTPKPPWMKEPCPRSRDEARAAKERLDKPLQYLRNPHFQTPNSRGGRSLIVPPKTECSARSGKKRQSCSSGHEAPVPIFVVKPPVVLFSEYHIGQVYEVTVEMRNMTAASRHVRVIPPTTPHFSVGLIKFPGEGGTVAPGMSCQFTVRFSPDSLANYEDFLVVETHSPHPLIVPLQAHRNPPILTLPAVLNLGCCLVGGVKVVEVMCHNVGESSGTFCIMPKSQWLASNVRSVVKASFAEQPPFAVSPCLFELPPGHTVVLEVVFFPTIADTCAQIFTTICDNCQVKDFTIKGTGQHVALELVEVEGGEYMPHQLEQRDMTADHFVRFDPTNPKSELQKTVVVRNNTHLELPFSWQIMLPKLKPLLPRETLDLSSIKHDAATDKIFSISPASGHLGPLQSHEFLLTYHPQELKEYHRVCHLIIKDVPDVRQSSEDVSQHLDPVYGVSDVTVMEIDVKGFTEPYQVLLEPYLIEMENDCYINIPFRKSFKMWNHSKTNICFVWERISEPHNIEVEPSSGEIEINECMDMNLILTGGHPGHFSTVLQCHVQHRPSPIGLPIKVTFMGPSLKLNIPVLDLGLLQCGHVACSSLRINNISPLEAHWSLEKASGDAGVSQEQLKVQPIRGTLPPLASCTVGLLFKAALCGAVESVLQLSVLNGKNCYLPVRAVVGSPRVCLLDSEPELPDLYVGIEKTFTVTVINQTHLPAHFRWTEVCVRGVVSERQCVWESDDLWEIISHELKGAQASLCTACFTPSSGSLGPKEKKDICVSFTTDTDKELTITSVCEVDGMTDPAVLRFPCRAKNLSVSYSLPPSDCGLNEEDQQPVILDFNGGENVLVGKSAHRQLLMTNHTPIPATFTVEAMVFAGRPAKHSAYIRIPIHEKQAKKIQEKQHMDFVSSLLDHGKGAAFYVEPNRGKLGPFETVSISVSAYNNMWGYYQDQLVCKVGDLDPTFIPMRLSVSGCPIYFQMIGPQPDNQNQGPVVRFGAHISGGDTVSRPLYLKNTSPYDIRVDWLTYNKDPEDKKLIDLMVVCGKPFPLKDADGNEIIGGLNSSFTAPRSVEQSRTSSTDTTSSTSFRTREYDLGKGLCEKEERASPVSPAAEMKLISVFIQPHEGNASDYPYCITPQQIVIPAKGSSTIHVSFTPPTLSEPAQDTQCVGYALGFMSLDNKASTGLLGDVFWAEGYELEPLRLDLLARVEMARLTIKLEDEAEALEFSTAASDLLDGEILRKEVLVVQDLPVCNSGDMPLTFQLSAHPPFSVLQPEHQLQHQHQQRYTTSSSSSSHSFKSTPELCLLPTLQLKPKKCIKVKVAFHLLSSFLSQRLSSMLPGGEEEQRRLNFRGHLNIQYSNNAVQFVPLCAQLELPVLYVSCSSVDFGLCYVGETRMERVYLYNQGASSSLWSAFIEQEEGSEVFSVSPERGLLKPLVYPVSSCRQRLEISFTASDQRLFEGRIKVQGILGEPPLTLQVKGRGSFDERHSDNA